MILSRTPDDGTLGHWHMGQAVLLVNAGHGEYSLPDRQSGDMPKVKVVAFSLEATPQEAARKIANNAGVRRD